MRINFVSVADKSMASRRYHVDLPAAQLASAKHEVTVATYPLVADINVFSKHWNYGDPVYAKGVQAMGGKAVFHICDDHFETEHVDHYRKMIHACDVVVSSTKFLARRVKEETGIEPVVIEDSFEGQKKKPEYDPNEKLNVLWFGHHSNLDSLAEIMPLGGNYQLMIVTTQGLRMPEVFKGAMAKAWSPSNMEQAFNWADVVIIPVRDELRKFSKSHNRLTEAVVRGKFVIAGKLDSYMPYEDSMWVGDVREGLQWVQLQKKEEIERRIAEAQKLAYHKYAPPVIGKKWETVLSEVHYGTAKTAT
jgi:hypothetical protein